MNKTLYRLIRGLAVIAAAAPLAAQAFYPPIPAALAQLPYPLPLPTTSVPAPVMPMMPPGPNYPGPAYLRQPPMPPMPYPAHMARPAPFSDPSWSSARYAPRPYPAPWQYAQAAAPRPPMPAGQLPAFPIPAHVARYQPPRPPILRHGNPWAQAPGWQPRFRPAPPPRYVYRPQPAGQPYPAAAYPHMPPPMPMVASAPRTYNPWMVPMAPRVKPMPAPRRAMGRPAAVTAGLPPRWQQAPRVGAVPVPAAYRMPVPRGRLPAWPGRAGAPAPVMPTAMMAPRFQPQPGGWRPPAMLPQPQRRSMPPAPLWQARSPQPSLQDAPPPPQAWADMAPAMPRSNPGMAVPMRSVPPQRDLLVMRQAMPADRRRDNVRNWR